MTNAQDVHALPIVLGRRRPGPVLAEEVLGPASGTDPGPAAERDAAHSPADGPRRVVTALGRRDSGYRYMIDVCDRIADAALTGAGAPELARMLAGLTGRSVILLDAQFRLRTQARGDAAHVPWRAEDPGIARLLKALAAGRRPVRQPAALDSVLRHGCLAVPIGIGAAELGHLVIVEGADRAGGLRAATGGPESQDDVDQLVAGYVATLFALSLTAGRTGADMGLHYRATVVDALVSGQFADPADARRKLDALGIGEEPTYRVAVVAPVGESGPEQLAPPLAEELREVLRQVLPDADAAVRPSELVIIVPARPSGQEDVEQRLQRVVERLASRDASAQRLVCGLSDATDRPEEAPRLHREAQHAVEAGSRISRFGRVVTYADLGIYGLLLQVGDEDLLARFADAVLGPLVRYDAAHKLSLVHTLSVFLNQRESLKQAARRLDVHANTVTYRLQRIEQLTPLRLSDPDDRLLAHMAVKILEFRRSGPASARPTRPA